MGNAHPPFVNLTHANFSTDFKNIEVFIYCILTDFVNCTALVS